MPQDNSTCGAKRANPGYAAFQIARALSTSEQHGEAALLTAVWLARNGAADEARGLVEATAPHFARLRFYPKPAEHPMPLGARIFLESAGTVLGRLRSIQPNVRILTQREAVQVWTPLYGKMVALFLETVGGDTPGIQPDAEGRWVSPETRRFYVIGGWPCQNYAVDWRERARDVVAAIEQARAAHLLCRGPDDVRHSFSRLLGYLRKCNADPASLTGRDVGMIRLILARHVSSGGLPGSASHEAASARQLSPVAKPMHHQIAGIVAHRMANLPADSGVDDTADVLQPVTTNEASTGGVTAGTEIPVSIGRKVERCLCDTADALVERQVSRLYYERLFPAKIARQCGRRRRKRSRNYSRHRAISCAIRYCWNSSDCSARKG